MKAFAVALAYIGAWWLFVGIDVLRTTDHRSWALTTASWTFILGSLFFFGAARWVWREA